MRISKRWLLILLLVASQAVCLLPGVAWFSGWLRSNLMQTLQQQVLADNQLAAQQVAALIDQMKLDSVQPGSAGWERLQTAVEAIHLPNDGFVSIVDAETGRLLCQPALRENPALGESRLGQSNLINPQGDQPIIAVDASLGASGWLQMPDGMQLVAIYDLPLLHAKVIAHRREQLIQAETARIVEPVHRIGTWTATAMVLISALLTMLIAHRYENKVASVNFLLKQLVDKRTQALMKTRNAVIFGLAKLAESRDNETGAHLERIRSYVTLLVVKLAESHREINEAYIGNLGLASSLHDIGKVGIPDAILLKPGPLTKAEREIMQRHAEIGGDCLSAIARRLGEDDFLEMAKTIAYAHHEHWNGRGYPRGLKEEQIPLAARIVALADVYDALTTKRVYKPALSHFEARTIITSGSGSQFDPEVVAAFLACEEQIQQISARSVAELDVEAELEAIEDRSPALVS
ncbi:MAG TPA: HD domain-containing phosphohydrolase [Pirellulales bacterium]|nr:HD domain-containing phosphohydrolase [Pirellulales bacterium]